MNWENDQGGNYYDDDQIVHHERGLLENEHDSQDEAEKSEDEGEGEEGSEEGSADGIGDIEEQGDGNEEDEDDEDVDDEDDDDIARASTAQVNSSSTARKNERGALDALLEAATGAAPSGGAFHADAGAAWGTGMQGFEGRGRSGGAHPGARYTNGQGAPSFQEDLGVSGYPDGGNEISHAEQVLMEASKKEKPKKRDNKEWPAAKRKVKKSEHESLAADTRAWVLKMQKQQQTSEREGRGLSDLQIARWSGVPIERYQGYMQGEVDPRVTNQLRRYVKGMLDKEEKKKQEADLAAKAGGGAGAEGEGGGVGDAGNSNSNKHTIKVEKVEAVSMKEKAQAFDPFFLDSLDTLTPQGRYTFPECTVPILIDVTEGTVTVRETLLWNLKDETVDPESAAAILCKHAPVLISSALAARVAASIRAQVESSPLFAPPRRNCKEASRLAQLNITVDVDGTVIEDHLIWDLEDMSSNPHSVALVMCHDLGLPSHLVPRVSYQIRQQLADLRSKLWMQEESDAAALHALPLARDAPEAQATMLHSLHFSSTVHPLECVAKWTPKIGGQVCMAVPNSLPEPSQYIPAEREEQEHVERDWMQEQGDREPPRQWDRDEAYMQGERDIDPTQRKRKPKNLNAFGSQRNSMSNSMSLNTPGSHRSSTNLNASEARHNSSGLTVTARKRQTSASNAGSNAPDALDASHAGAEGGLAYGTHRVAYDATQRVTEGDVIGAAPSQQKKRRKCKDAEEAMWEHRRGGIDVTREVGGMLGVDGAGVGAEQVQQGGTGIQIQMGRGKMNKSNHQSLHQYVKTWTKETSVAKMSMGCGEQGGGLARSFSPNPYGFGDAGRGDVGIGGVMSSDGGGSSDGAVVSSNRMQQLPPLSETGGMPGVPLRMVGSGGGGGGGVGLGALLSRDSSDEARRREAASRSQGRVGGGSHMAVAGHRSFSPDSAPADQRILLDRGFGAGVIGRSGVGAGSGGNAHVFAHQQAHLSAAHLTGVDRPNAQTLLGISSTISLGMRGGAGIGGNHGSSFGQRTSGIMLGSSGGGADAISLNPLLYHTSGSNSNDGGVLPAMVSAGGVGGGVNGGMGVARDTIRHNSNWGAHFARDGQH